MNKRRLLIALMLLSPALLQANTGAPILIGLSFPIFILGFAAIVLIEALYIWKLAKIGLWRSLSDSFTVNFTTSLIGGIALPIIVSIIGFTCYMWPTPTLRQFFSYFGTMGYRGNEAPLPSIAFALGWLAITFLITIYLEAKFLDRLWKGRNLEPPIKSTSLSWRSHTISYSVLLALYAVGYYFLHHRKS